MLKKKFYSLFVLTLALVVIGGGCSLNPKTNQGTTTIPGQDKQKQEKSYTMEESKHTAMKWIEDESPTYIFDGSKLELKESEEIGGKACKGCYQFMFNFESSHGGYGDRGDMMVTQVITPHDIRVVVKNGEVVQAVTDGKFDEMTGEMVKSEQNIDQEESSEESEEIGKSKSIKLKNISEGDTISRTATITGEAKGPWFFEGQFSLVAKDTDGKEIEGFTVKSQGNWMQEGYVPFKTDLDLTDYSGDSVILEFQQADPSGKKNDAQKHTVEVKLK